MRVDILIVVMVNTRSNFKSLQICFDLKYCKVPVVSFVYISIKEFRRWMVSISYAICTSREP